MIDLKSINEFGNFQLFCDVGNFAPAKIDNSARVEAGAEKGAKTFSPATMQNGRCSTAL